MNKILSKLCVCLTAFAQLITLDDCVITPAEAMETLPTADMSMQKFCQTKLEPNITAFARDSIAILNSYNELANYCSKMFDFPMFWNIPLQNFPTEIWHLRPSDRSSELRENCLKADYFAQTIAIQSEVMFNTLVKNKYSDLKSCEKKLFRNVFANSFSQFYPLYVFEDLANITCIDNLSKFKEFINNETDQPPFTQIVNQINILVSSELSLLDSIKKDIELFSSSVSDKESFYPIKYIYDQAIYLANNLKGFSGAISIFPTFPKTINQIYDDAFNQVKSLSDNLEEFSQSPELTKIPELNQLYEEIYNQKKLIQRAETLSSQKLLAAMKFEAIDNGFYDLINNASLTINCYNKLVEYFNKVFQFPMFFDIPEENFPKGLQYYKPTELSMSERKKLQNAEQLIIKLKEEIINEVDLLSKAAPCDISQDALQKLPKIDPLIIIAAENEIKHRYGLGDLEKFITNFYREVGSEDSDYSKLMRKIQIFQYYFRDTVNVMSSLNKNVVSLYYFCNSHDDLKNQQTVLRNLFNDSSSLLKILDSRGTSNGMANVSLSGIFWAFPQNVEELYERLDLENYRREIAAYRRSSSGSFDLCEECRKALAAFPAMIITPTPDITPVISHLQGTWQTPANAAIELFAHAANRQFTIPVVAVYYNDEYTDMIQEVINQESFPVFEF